MPSLFGHQHDVTVPISVDEVASTLARIPRWNAQTIVSWSVLQHSLAAAVLASPFSTETQLYALWHDCEEAFTNDIPMPYKQPEQVKFGDDLRLVVYCNALKMPAPSTSVIERVHDIDQRLRNAEAHAFLHPRFAREFELALDLADVDVVWGLIEASRETCIATFVRSTQALLARADIRALQRRA